MSGWRAGGAEAARVAAAAASFFSLRCPWRAAGILSLVAMSLLRLRQRATRPIAWCRWWVAVGSWARPCCLAALPALSVCGWWQAFTVCRMEAAPCYRGWLVAAQQAATGDGAGRQRQRRRPPPTTPRRGTDARGQQLQEQRRRSSRGGSLERRTDPPAEQAPPAEAAAAAQHAGRCSSCRRVRCCC